MIRAGQLVNNVDCEDYNHGMVLETHVNITEELFRNGAEFIENDLELSYLETEPQGARVMWECGTINVHYTDELEVIRDEKQETESL